MLFYCLLQAFLPYYLLPFLHQPFLYITIVYIYLYQWFIFFFSALSLSASCSLTCGRLFVFMNLIYLTGLFPNWAFFLPLPLSFLIYAFLLNSPVLASVHTRKVKACRYTLQAVPSDFFHQCFVITIICLIFFLSDFPKLSYLSCSCPEQPFLASGISSSPFVIFKLIIVFIFRQNNSKINSSCKSVSTKLP